MDSRGRPFAGEAPIARVLVLMLLAVSLASRGAAQIPHRAAAGLEHAAGAAADLKLCAAPEATGALGHDCASCPLCQKEASGAVCPGAETWSAGVALAPLAARAASAVSRRPPDLSAASPRGPPPFSPAAV
jgi:hypothetical protein